MSEISSETHALADQRNGLQRDRRRRHAVRLQRSQRTHAPHHLSRSPARAWKREDLAAVQLPYDIKLSQVYDDDYDYIDAADRYESFRCKIYATQAMRQAIGIQSVRSLRRAIYAFSYYSKLCKRSARLRKKRSSHTVLTRAIARGGAECVQAILDGVRQRHIYRTIVEHVNTDGRTALWHACNKGSFELVELLVREGRANVNRCGALIVAVQNGHTHVVDYLLRHDANPNRRAKNYNETALHAAARRNRLELVKVLLKYGANPHALDDRKRTPLDYAIHKRHNDVATVLIRQCRGRFTMNGAGFTPLMLATSCDNTPAVNILSDILPKQRVLDELQLLACEYIIGGQTAKRDTAYCYFERALSTHTAGAGECQTLDELAAIRDDDDALRLHAERVAERLHMQIGDVNRLLFLLTKQSCFYRWKGALDRCLELQLRVYQMRMELQDTHQCNSTVKNVDVHGMVCVLYRILETSGTVSVHWIARIWSWVSAENDSKCTNVKLRLFLITAYLLDKGKVRRGEHQLLWELLRRIVRANPRVGRGYSLLGHVILLSASSDDEFRILRIGVPIMPLLRLLIEAGADVNVRQSSTRSTPLHLAAQFNSFDRARPIIELLLNANAHLDSVNIFGLRPSDVGKNTEIRELLRSRQQLSLRCRCAQVIVANKLPYDELYSTYLCRFVALHDTRR